MFRSTAARGYLLGGFRFVLGKATLLRLDDMITRIARITLLASAGALVLLTGAASGAAEKETLAGIPNPRGVYSGCSEQATGELRLFPGSKGLPHR